VWVEVDHRWPQFDELNQDARLQPLGVPESGPYIYPAPPTGASMSRGIGRARRANDLADSIGIHDERF
jgi:hypothetical protein